MCVMDDRAFDLTRMQLEHDMTQMRNDYEPWVYAPSYWAALAVSEGKSLGTAPGEDLVLMKDLDTQRDYHPSKFQARRQIGHTVGGRKLKQVQAETRDALHVSIAGFTSGAVDEDELREDVTEVMRKAWKDVFMAGVRSAGHPGTGSGNTLGVKLGEGDDRWLKGAVKHELRYLNRFLTDIVEGGGRMPYYQRADMYVDTLKGFYESARVIALPPNVLISWHGKHDANRCPGCKFLQEHSPYTKWTLPGTPKSGVCNCLSRCRCRILVRMVPMEEAQQYMVDQEKTRAGYLRVLNRLKRQR